MTTSTHILQPNTQAILLLCAGFGESRQQGAKPLSLGEYNSLAQKLHQHNLQPVDLLSKTGKDWILKQIDPSLGANRVLELLERGAMLAVAVEGWTNKGLWVLSRSDQAYPQRLKRKLKQLSPPILYGVGNQALLSDGGLAIVGSREVDDEGVEYTQRVAQKCAEQGMQIVSGGARGVDQGAMLAALGVGGNSVGVLADSLMKAAVSMKYREGLRQGRLVLISPYDPSAGFNVGNAMNRNKSVYALADHALIVNSAYETGGTWAGAKEELKREDSMPVWVRVQGEVCRGNQELLKLGAMPFPLEPWNRKMRDLLEETKELIKIEAAQNTPKQLSLTEILPIPEEIVTLKDEALETASMLLLPPKAEPVELQNEGQENSLKLPKDAYEAVLPLLLHYLSEIKKEKQVAELLDVGVGQARIWLKRAVEEKLLDKKKAGYVLSSKQD